MTEVSHTLTMFYVADLASSARFYDSVFGFRKTVDVPVYVEYELATGVRFGLMPQGNTRHFLGDDLGSRKPTDGCPRAELYLQVSDLGGVIDRLEQAGATCTSPLADRDWGDRAAYFMDPDGYVLVVAEPL